jgi:transcription initiation factor TFIID subunit TAF12
MQSSAQPSKASRWGSLLQQAVAGVESRLDTILAEPDSSPKKATKELDGNSQQQQQQQTQTQTQQQTQQQQRVRKDSVSAVPPSLKAENGKCFLLVTLLRNGSTLRFRGERLIF